MKNIDRACTCIRIRRPVDSPVEIRPSMYAQDYHDIAIDRCPSRAIVGSIVRVFSCTVRVRVNVRFFGFGSVERAILAFRCAKAGAGKQPTRHNDKKHLRCNIVQRQAGKALRATSMAHRSAL
ncbi:hypothetical protein KCU85_g364, partial [Aureobasidium melanogenum]